MQDDVPVKRKQTCAAPGCARTYYAKGECRYHYDLTKRGAIEAARVPGVESLPGETWRDIPGYGSDFSVSNIGRVRTNYRTYTRNGTTVQVAEKLKSQRNQNGYRMVQLGVGGGASQMERVHRLVAAAFIGPCPEGMEVCHNNGRRDDNRVENLRYGTRSENNYDQVTHGTHSMANRTECPNGHPYTPENTYMSQRGRNCRVCMRRRGRKQEARQRARKHA